MTDKQFEDLLCAAGVAKSKYGMYVIGEDRLRAFAELCRASAITDQSDPCPGCEPDTVCRTLACGRLKNY